MLNMAHSIASSFVMAPPPPITWWYWYLSDRSIIRINTQKSMNYFFMNNVNQFVFRIFISLTWRSSNTLGPIWHHFVWLTPTTWRFRYTGSQILMKYLDPVLSPSRPYFYLINIGLQNTVKDWNLRERFPGRSFGGYSILKVRIWRPQFTQVYSF